MRAGSTKQVASAVGEGAAAALLSRYHLDAMADGTRSVAPATDALPA